MNWNKSNTLFFIDLIRERPVIWDASWPDYKNKNKRREAIAEVSKLMGITAKEVNTKWTSLRGQYNREKKKYPEIHTSKWFAYKVIESMMDNVPQDSFCDIIKEETTYTYPSTPPPPTTPTPPPTMLTPPPTMPIMPTPPPTMPIMPTLQPKCCSVMKKKRYGGTSLQAEALDSFHVIKDRRRDSHRELVANDDISAFGLYVSAQLRQFGRRLQTKAKLEISKLLYNIELEHLENTTRSSVERNQSSNLSNYLEFEDSMESSTNQPTIAFNAR